jgi:hypothetical protein
VKVDELITFLSKQEIKSINGTPLNEVWKMHADIEDIYIELKEKSDEINEKKQEEANIYANKSLNETDFTERAMRVYEKSIFEEEFKIRNETEIADLKAYLKNKHESDVKLKHLLIESRQSKNLFLEMIMQERRKELESATDEYVKSKTEQIKQQILEAAKKENKKEINKKLMEDNRKRQAERLAKAAKERDPDDLGEDGGLRRAGFGTERPQETSFSQKKGYTGKSTRTREEDTGFKRNAFGAVKPDESKEEDKERGPPKFSGPPKFTGTAGGPPKFSGPVKTTTAGGPSKPSNSEGGNKPSTSGSSKLGPRVKKDNDMGWRKKDSKASTEDKKDSSKPKPKPKDKKEEDGMGRFSSGGW